MLQFEIPEVDAKYKALVEKDMIVHVAIAYGGLLSKIPLPLADKLFADGAAIELKKPEKPADAKDDKAADKGTTK